ncbi:MAG: YhcH/YjgK/YiaL family protein [Bacteroidota bacterium]
MKKLSLLLLLFTITFYSASAQTDAKKWFKARAYLNGLKLIPHESTDAAEFARQYAANKDQWDKAFAYLKNTDLDKIPPGKYPIEGTDLFASVSESPTKDFDKTLWESHRKVIDLQYVIQGAEKISVFPVANAKVTVPYDEAKDVARYEADGTVYTAVPGTFFLFFPSDAHRPSIKADGFDKDKKIVIKIKYIQ